MSKIIKSKKFLWFVGLCLLGSLLLVIFNLSLFKKYQVTQRNNERKTEIKTVIDGVKKYTTENNNLPTTSNPSEKSFLPELILLDNNKPTGGVGVQTMENMNGYLDTSIKDPSGDPYFIGTFENSVIVYTNNLELEDGKHDIYFETFKLETNSGGELKGE